MNLLPIIILLLLLLRLLTQIFDPNMIVDTSADLTKEVDKGCLQFAEK